MIIFSLSTINAMHKDAQDTKDALVEFEAKTETKTAPTPTLLTRAARIGHLCGEFLKLHIFDPIADRKKRAFLCNLTVEHLYELSSEQITLILLDKDWLRVCKKCIDTKEFMVTETVGNRQNIITLMEYPPALLVKIALDLNKPELIRSLAGAGIDWDKEIENQTLLMFVTGLGHIPIMHALLDAGASTGNAGIIARDTYRRDEIRRLSNLYGITHDRNAIIKFLEYYALYRGLTEYLQDDKSDVKIADKPLQT